MNGPAARSQGDVAGQAADIGALGDARGEGGIAAAHKRMDRHTARLEHHLFARPRQIIGAPAVHLERGIGRRHLLDRPGEARQHCVDLVGRGAHVARRDRDPFGIERVGLRPEADREFVDLVGVELGAYGSGGRDTEELDADKIFAKLKSLKGPEPEEDEE